VGVMSKSVQTRGKRGGLGTGPSTGKEFDFLFGHGKKEEKKCGRGFCETKKWPGEGGSSF